MISDLNGSLGSRYFLYVMNERTSVREHLRDVERNEKDASKAVADDDKS